MKVHRRAFLADFGLGFTGLALGAMLQRDGVVRAEPHANPPLAHALGSLHHAPKAKSVIWIFLSGGYSHLETFDPKPALNRYAGLTFDRAPFANPLQSPLHDRRSRSVVAAEINELVEIDATVPAKKRVTLGVLLACRPWNISIVHALRIDAGTEVSKKTTRP